MGITQHYGWILLYCFHGTYDCRKTLLDYINLFCPNDYQNNEKVMYTYTLSFHYFDSH